MPCRAAAFKAMQAELAAEAEAEAAAAEGAAAQPDDDVPTKVVSREVALSLRARVLRFDYDGLSGEAVEAVAAARGQAGFGWVAAGGCACPLSPLIHYSSCRPPSCCGPDCFRCAATYLPGAFVRAWRWHRWRADGRSLRTMLSHVAPRCVILVHASGAATSALQGWLSSELAGLLTQVHAPQAGQAVELPAEPAYRLALRCAYSLPPAAAAPSGRCRSIMQECCDGVAALTVVTDLVEEAQLSHLDPPHPSPSPTSRCPPSSRCPPPSSSPTPLPPACPRLSCLQRRADGGRADARHWRVPPGLGGGGGGAARRGLRGAGLYRTAVLCCKPGRGGVLQRRPRPLPARLAVVQFTSLALTPLPAPPPNPSACARALAACRASCRSCCPRQRRQRRRQQQGARRRAPTAASSLGRAGGGGRGEGGGGGGRRRLH